MAVVAFQQHWAIAEDFVEIFFVRQGFGAEHRVIPTAAEHPIFTGVFRGVIAQALLNVGCVLRAFEVDSPEAQRAGEEMDVAIDEAGQDQVSGAVDHLSTCVG